MREDLLLLDTDIVSLFGRPTPPPGLRPWLLNVGIGRLAISYPTITELLRGAHLLRKTDPVRAETIEAWVNRLIATRFPSPRMNAKVADIYAHMTSVPSLRNMWTVQHHQKSNRLGHDLMIAAVAITHRLPIVTGNIRDFRRIHECFPLPGIYHPMAERWFVDPKEPVALASFEPTAMEPAHNPLPTIGDERPLKGLVYDKPKFFPLSGQARLLMRRSSIYGTDPRASIVDARTRK